MIPLHQFSSDNSSMFFLILISFLSIGLLRAFYWKHAKLLLIAPFQYRYASQYLRQDNAFTERVNWLSFIILLINFSLVLAFNEQVLFFETPLLIISLVFIQLFIGVFVVLSNVQVSLGSIHQIIGTLLFVFTTCYSLKIIKNYFCRSVVFK